MGAISFSLGLVLVVLTHSELLTSNFMYLTVGWYYKVISMKKSRLDFYFLFYWEYYWWIYSILLNEVFTRDDT